MEYIINQLKERENDNTENMKWLVKMTILTFKDGLHPIYHFPLKW